MKLKDYLRQSIVAQEQVRAEVLRMMPAFPKPHIKRSNGVWACTRVVYQDEFLCAYGLTPRAAFDAAANGMVDPGIELAFVMNNAPAWTLENA